MLCNTDNIYHYILHLKVDHNQIIKIALHRLIHFTVNATAETKKLQDNCS